MECKRCGHQLSSSESYEYLGQTLCEDCYIDRYQASITACDPLAVQAASRSREKLGLKGAEGLTEMEKKVYEFVKSKGRATREEVMEKFSLSELDLKAQLITLMHSELVKEHSEGDQMYLIPIG